MNYKCIKYLFYIGNNNCDVLPSVKLAKSKKFFFTLFDDVMKLSILVYTNDLLELVMNRLKNRTSKKAGIKVVFTLAAVPSHQTWLHLEKR